TELCNLACIHCAHPVFKKSKFYAGRSLDPELNEKLVHEVREHGRGHTQYIRYTSEGEPLLDPNIFEMIACAVRGSGVTVTLTTNGTLLNEERAERLFGTGVHVIDVSIDAFSPETYAKVRVKGDLEVTRSNVLRLLRMARSQNGPRIVVSYIEQPQNRHETGAFEAFWKEQGADYVVVRRMHSNSGSLGEVADRMRRENAAEDRRPCLYPWERIVLNPRGYLAFCPADWTHGSTMVDYRTATIRETWQGEFYRRLRQAHLANDFSAHGFCGQCPDWKATRWPGDGRSYANMIEEFKDLE
ncbi:MAG: radical SAM/SPASM domain-containing protein, partial [Actinomycetota bacterium]